MERLLDTIAQRFQTRAAPRRFYFAGSMRFYVQRVLVPYQKADAAAHGRPRGNLSDLYPRWLGTRELLLQTIATHIAPEVTREIQNGYYGRPLEYPERTDDPKDQQGFAYPLHVVFSAGSHSWFAVSLKCRPDSAGCS